MNGKKLLKEKDKPKKERVVPIAKLIKLLDAEFSKYVRRMEKGVCFTCGVQKDPKEMQNGHYESRSHFETRWDLRNCHCQCYSCNVMRNGNMTNYAINLVRKYDKGILERLHKLAQTPVKLKREDLEAQIEFYKKENEK